MVTFHTWKVPALNIDGTGRYANPSSLSFVPRGEILVYSGYGIYVVLYYPIDLIVTDSMYASRECSRKEARLLERLVYIGLEDAK